MEEEHEGRTIEQPRVGNIVECSFKVGMIKYVKTENENGVGTVITYTLNSLDESAGVGSLAIKMVEGEKLELGQGDRIEVKITSSQQRLG